MYTQHYKTLVTLAVCYAVIADRCFLYCIVISACVQLIATAIILCGMHVLYSDLKGR
jgi:hypothetical protein